MNPPAFLERWYSSLAKRYICDILDYENVKASNPRSLFLEIMK
jgi:hypothetical protein